MTSPATFDSIPEVSLGQDSDMFLVRQNGVAVSQKRGALASSLGNASWTNTADYLTGSEVIYNSKRYRALQNNGVSFSNISIPDSTPDVWLDLQTALDDKYSPENKPSAADLQALPITGGELTGNLDIKTTDFARLFLIGANNRDALISLREGDITGGGYGFDIRYDGSLTNELQIDSIVNGVKKSVMAANRTSGNVSFGGRLLTTEDEGHIYTTGVDADIYTEEGQIKEQGQRVYSPNNKPTIDDVTGLLAKIQELENRLTNLGG